MPAPTGNTNATKWTEERTLSTLTQIEKYAEMEHVHTLSRALVKVHIYQGIWIYWKRRWAQHEEIMDRICYIEQIFMMKIEEGGLSKRWHAGICLFMLRVNYGQREVAVPYDKKKLIADELPPHLVRSYDIARQADRDIEQEKQNKRRKLEEEKAREERAAKKASRQKAKTESADTKPMISCHDTSLPLDQRVAAPDSPLRHMQPPQHTVQVIDINRRE